jgi:hypothetical protein
MDPTRPYRIITGVVREALRSSGRPGVVLCGVGPEEDLLRRWLRKAQVPFVTPGTASVEGARELLDSLLRQAGGTLELATRASELAGRAHAWAEGLLLLGSSNKTCLLLSPIRTSCEVLPLGDLFASQISELTGDSTLPPCLRNISVERVRAVDKALADYYEEGYGEDRAFRDLESDLRRTVLSALTQARRGWHPRPLVPKLGRATLGLDLDP